VPRLPASNPNLNAYAERFVRSIRSERLDRIVPLGETHLRRSVHEFVWGEGVDGRDDYQTKLLLSFLSPSTNGRWWYDDFNKSGRHVIDETGDKPLVRQ
jgi:hypothetical protein